MLIYLLSVCKLKYESVSDLPALGGNCLFYNEQGSGEEQKRGLFQNNDYWNLLEMMRETEREGERERERERERETERERESTL